MKIGLLKQTFDPVTIQDIEFSISQIKKKNLDEVWFIVLYDHNKVKVSQRQNMILIALENINNIKLSNLSLVKETKNEYVLLDNDESFKINKEIHQGFFKYIDNKVKNHILQNQFYLEEVAFNNLSSYRYKHSVSVASVCVSLAKIHKIDTNKAYIAGLLHDICKDKPYEYTMDVMNKHFANLLNEPYEIYHAYTSMIFLKENLLIDEQEILNAVFNHTTGNDYSDLSMLVYVSDKLDPLRGYDVSYEFNLSSMNLLEGFNYIKEQQLRYLKEKK